MIVGAVALLILANVAFALKTVADTWRPAEMVTPWDRLNDLPSVSIVVPARDEERQIEACVRGLLAQTHPDFEVIVVDDRSSDATAEILDRIALEDPRLTVVRGEPLPDGWVGKPWALVQGVRIARASWLLFTDADTFHSSVSAASVQHVALEQKLDVLSVLTEQDLVTLPERALMPSVFMAILMGIGPIADVADPNKPDVTLFNGQYILAQRSAYDAIGGHASVSGEIAEDMELARRFKRDGRFRIALMGSLGIARTRMYRSFGEIWNGFVKNFALGVRGKPAWAAGGLALFACLSPVSPAVLAYLLVTARWAPAAGLAAAMCCTIAAAVYGMRRMWLPPWSGLWLPLGNAFVLTVLATSMLRFATGRGVVWRGRHYGRSYGSP